MGGEGMNIVKSFPRDSNDEGVVLSATCDLCHTEFDHVPANQPKCKDCGVTGCPECRHQMFMDQCDECDEWICLNHWQNYDGFRLCLKAECLEKAKQNSKQAKVYAASLDNLRRIA